MRSSQDHYPFGCYSSTPFLVQYGFAKIAIQSNLGTELGEGDATRQKSMKKGAFSLNEGKAFSG